MTLPKGQGSVTTQIQQVFAQADRDGNDEVAAFMRQRFARALAIADGRPPPPRRSKFSFSRRIASANGWIVLKHGLIIRKGANDVLAGILSDAPPSGRRMWLYVMPLFSGSFDLSVLSYSEELSYENSDVMEDNQATTVRVIERYAEKVEPLASDATYRTLLDRLASQPLGWDARRSFDVAATAVMAADTERATEALQHTLRADHEPRDWFREARALADKLSVELARSLEEAQRFLTALSNERRAQIGLQTVPGATP